ncbi:MAG: SDR family oxidoreductase [Promethearchaeota archaeon]|jgi:NAD(P)-dependent dehydrogenase (short-subunit alcohol dehydrogenase family)
MSMNVALITGGNRGIGFEICRQLGKEGFNVILTARDAIKGKRATEKLVNMDLKVEFHKLDVTNTNDIDEIVDYVNKTYKKLDILVNNAGISLDSKTILDVEMETVRKTLETNLIGPFRLSQAFISLLKKSGDGRIINVSSGMGSFSSGFSGSPAYSISKAALNALTYKMSMRLPKKIRIYSMTPGWVRTDMGGSSAPRNVEQGADTVLWLATASNIPSGKFYMDRKEIPW